MNKKAKEAKILAKVARDLIYLSGKKFEYSTSIYAIAIDEALKATGKSSYSGHPRVFIKENLAHLQAYCKTNSKRLGEVKTIRQQPRSLTRGRIFSDPKHAFVMSDDFLQTYEWRRVRMEALKKHGARCQCCGASPAEGAVMNVDHIKPRKLFPQLALDLDNLQVLCHECNHGKGNWDMTDWRSVEEVDPAVKEHLRSIMQEKT